MSLIVSKIFTMPLSEACLLLGCKQSVQPYILNKLNINTLINVTPDIIFPTFVQNSVYKKIRIPIYDAPIQNYVFHEFANTTSDFINEELYNKRNILIYCNKGMQRSPSITVAYLMLYNGYSFHDAVNYVTKIHHIAFPNKYMTFRMPLVTLFKLRN